MLHNLFWLLITIFRRHLWPCISEGICWTWSWMNWTAWHRLASVFWNWHFTVLNLCQPCYYYDTCWCSKNPQDVTSCSADVRGLRVQWGFRVVVATTHTPISWTQELLRSWKYKGQDHKLAFTERPFLGQGLIAHWSSTCLHRERCQFQVLWKIFARD